MPATTATDAARCPRCGAATASIRDATAWCPACEWNLDRYEPHRHRPEIGWQWLDRRTHTLAYRLTRRQFSDLAEQAIARAGWGMPRIVTVAASVFLMAGVLALAIAGGWLVATWRFPALDILPGVAMLGLAVALRPRLGRIAPDAEILSRDAAPALFRLIDEVATAIEAPAPHIVAVDPSFDAYTSAVGLRRRRVLCLGLGLWGALEPQERVALLGHELGHFVNGDIRRGLLTQPALTVLGSAADLVRPVESYAAYASSSVTGLGQLLVRPVQWVLSRVLLTAQLLLLWVGLRDGQRAEYLADDLAAKAAGSAAAVALCDTLLLMGTIEMVVRREARAKHGAARWREAASEARAAGAERLPLLRQLSIRDRVSLFASHPPAGLRARMVEAHPWRTPAVTLATSRVMQVEDELAADYERVRRSLAWTS